jgi:hypothetical protein
MRLRGRKNIRANVILSADDPSIVVLGLGPGATYECTIAEAIQIGLAIADVVEQANRRGGADG